MDELLRQAGSWPGRWLEPPPRPQHQQQQQEEEDGKDQEGVGRAAVACGERDGEPGLALGRKYWAERVSVANRWRLMSLSLAPPPHTPPPRHVARTTPLHSALAASRGGTPGWHRLLSFAHCCKPCTQFCALLASRQ